MFVLKVAAALTILTLLQTADTVFGNSCSEGVSTGSNCQVFSCNNIQYTVCCDSGYTPGFDCSTHKCLCNNDNSNSSMPPILIAVIVIVVIAVVGGVTACCFCCVGCPLYNRYSAKKEDAIALQAKPPQV
jgi:hypothetical protein